MAEFSNRVEAGQRLAHELAPLAGEDIVVLGLPRGGVPVAAEVARSLGVPLDVIVVRKLGVPAQPELAMGAIGEAGARFVDNRIVARAGVSPADLDRVEAREREVLEARVRRLRGGRPPVDLAGRTAVVVDDGIATGATARVACTVARHLGAARVVLAVPVGPESTLAAVTEADTVVCPVTPRRFLAVGQHYADFRPTTDEEVVALLAAATPCPKHPPVAAPTPPGGAGPSPPGAHGEDVEVGIPAGERTIAGTLHLAGGAVGTVLFAHGSGSSRFSPRNRYVASVLHDAGLSTLLLDLLTPGEEADRGNVFDIGLLAGRLLAASRWLRRDQRTGPLGYFGASTGAAAALQAAAEPGNDVAAVVSRGGRPDLAGPRLALVRAPTLLVVGGADHEVLDLNRRARALLRCPSELVVVPGATHLFEEPGTLAVAAGHAQRWFTRYLVPDAVGSDRPSGPSTPGRPGPPRGRAR